MMSLKSMLPSSEAVTGLLGSRPVSGVARAVTPHSLRVLAYHGIESQSAFAAQLDHLCAHFNPVGAADVLRAIVGESDLPKRPVWVTFDDGLASVVESALAALQERVIPATLFVCPGLIDGSRVPWWETVETALRHGWSEFDSVAGLKQIADSARREAVSSAAEFLNGRGVDAAQTVLSRSDLTEWLERGMEVGNHTWDHPCLDQCTPEEQLHQISRADSWLADFGAFDRGRVFAYPNGDWTEESEAALGATAYDLSLLFDHRLNRKTLDARRISRLRLDSSASPSRTRAIASGAHSSAFAVARGLRSFTHQRQERSP